MSNTVLITGSNRRIGLEFVKFVKQYLHDDWKVIACCRTPAKAAKLNDLLKKNVTTHPVIARRSRSNLLNY